MNLVDMFTGAWTASSRQASMLLQRAQAAVASGMTGLTQVTDCGFASQAKAALARHQEDLKRTLREKARQEGVQCQYKGRREGGHSHAVHETGRMVPLQTRY